MHKFIFYFLIWKANLTSNIIYFRQQTWRILLDIRQQLRTFIREEKSEKELQGKIKKNRGVKTQNLDTKLSTYTVRLN